MTCPRTVQVTGGIGTPKWARAGTNAQPRALGVLYLSGEGTFGGRSGR